MNQPTSYLAERKEFQRAVQSMRFIGGGRGSKEAVLGKKQIGYCKITLLTEDGKDLSGRLLTNYCLSDDY